jgi:signal peptidase I
MSETMLFGLIYFLAILRVVSYAAPRLFSSPALRNQVNETVDSIIYAGAAALFLIHFVVRSFYIPSGSMLETLQINDYILVNELQYDFAQPMRGEIAVFHPPAGSQTDHTDLIKRVVGLEGDKIEVRAGYLYRNDQKVTEDYVKYPIDGQYGPHIVQKGHVFMMGDNRNNSADSRFIGEIPLANYVGRAMVIFWPLSRMSYLKINSGTIDLSKQVDPPIRE